METVNDKQKPDNNLFATTMTRIFTLLLLFFGFSVGNLFAEVSRPESGITVDETRTISLLRDIPNQCMSLELDGLTIIFDRTIAESDAVFSLDRTWKTEKERMAVIKRDRARDMLSLLTDERDKSGCQKLHSLQQRELRNLYGARHFVENALENGQAVISKKGSDTLLDRIKVRYHGTNGIMGEIEFYLLEEKMPFLTVFWWIS